MEDVQSLFYFRAKNEIGRINVGDKILVSCELVPDAGAIVLTAPNLDLEVMDGRQKGRIIGVIKNSFIAY